MMGEAGEGLFLLRMEDECVCWLTCLSECRASMATNFEMFLARRPLLLSLPPGLPRQRHY